MPIGLMAVSKATLGMSKKMFKAKDKAFGAAVSKLTKNTEAVKEGKARVFKDDVKAGSKFYRKADVAAVRAEVNRPKRIPSVQETGRIKHPQNAWRQPQLSPDYHQRLQKRISSQNAGALPHQTSSWTKQKSSAEIGNYLAWKYKGFPEGGY